MRLYREVTRCIRWTGAVTLKFIDAAFAITSTVILLITVRDLFKLMAFMVPLKALLLAASSSVPSYFPLVDNATKDTWVIALAVGSLAIYLSIIVLNKLINQWSVKTSNIISKKANDIPMSNRDINLANKAYKGFTGIWASVFFLLATTVLLLLINIHVIAWFLLCFCIFLFLTGQVWLSNYSKLKLVKSWILEKYRDYIKYWETLSFFGAFFIILYPYLYDVNQTNVFNSLVSFIVSRRMLSEFANILITSIDLSAQRIAIDAIFFKQVSINRYHSDPTLSKLNHLYLKQNRDEIFFSDLPQQYLPDDTCSSLWLDSKPVQVKHFSVAMRRCDQTKPVTVELRVFTKDTMFQFEHHEILRNTILDKVISAAPAIKIKTIDQLKVVFRDQGHKNVARDVDWPVVHHSVVVDMFSISVPSSLYKSFRNTHSLLSDRFNTQLFAKLEIALDTLHDVELYGKWLRLVPQIVKKISTEPVVLVNPDLAPVNTLVDHNEHYSISYWGRWQLEPIGAAIAKQGLFSRGFQIFESVKTRRNDLQDRHWHSEIVISALCLQIENSINAQSFKKALEQIDSLVSILEKNGHLQ